MNVEATLTDGQRRAAAAIFESEDRESAARAAGVSPRTLFRWLQLPGFQGEVARQRTRALAAAADILARGSAAAARSLVAMAVGETKPSTGRAVACRAVLDLARRGAETDDLALRIGELEAAAAAAARPNFARSFS